MAARMPQPYVSSNQDVALNHQVHRLAEGLRKPLTGSMPFNLRA
jgi:hypothetical protein